MKMINRYCVFVLVLEINKLELSCSICFVWSDNPVIFVVNSHFLLLFFSSFLFYLVIDDQSMCEIIHKYSSSMNRYTTIQLCEMEAERMRRKCVLTIESTIVPKRNACQFDQHFGSLWFINCGKIRSTRTTHRHQLLIFFFS